MFFVLLADYTFFMAGSFTFFLIALGFFEPRDYRVVFLGQKAGFAKKPVFCHIRVCMDLRMTIS